MDQCAFLPVSNAEFSKRTASSERARGHEAASGDDIRTTRISARATKTRFRDTRTQALQFSKRMGEEKTKRGPVDTNGNAYITLQ